MVQPGKVSLNILIVAGRDLSFDWTSPNARQHNYRLAGQVESIAQAMQLIDQRPIDIILADSSAPGVTDTSWIQHLSVQSANTLVLVTAAATEMDFIREAMLAGAKGFLLKPFDLAELARSIDQVYQVWQQRQATLIDGRETMVPPTHEAPCLAVFSPKGGTGATTLAVNLAIALHQETAEPVLLVDADVRTADTDIFLSIFGKHSILDLLGIGQKLDEDMLKSVTTPHSSGITILRGESRLQFLEEPIDPGQMGGLIEELKSIWPGYIVVNTSSGLDRWTIEVLDVVDTVLVVTSPMLPALRVTRNLLELAEATEDDQHKWQVIMTSYQGQKVLRTADIEASIRYPITATIAEDNALVPMTINRGKPLIISHPNSSIARDIISLAKQITGTQAGNLRVPAPPEPKSNNQDGDSRKSARSGRRFFWQAVTQVFR